MKEYKIIQMNEGHARTLTNGSWHCARDYPWTEKMLNLHLRQGYTVKQMIATVTPGEPGSRGYAFYNDGFVFLLEHDTEQGEVTPEDWEKNNVLTEEDIAFLEECRAEERDPEQARVYEEYLKEAMERMEAEIDEILEEEVDEEVDKEIDAMLEAGEECFF